MELISRQAAIDVVAKQYNYEADRMTALQELPIFMQYRVGDRVKIVDEQVKGMCPLGDMNRWLGQTMTIAEIRRDGIYQYKMKEDGKTWDWNDDMIVGLAEPELTAKEAFDILSDIRSCRGRSCDDCPLSIQNNEGYRLCAEDFGVIISNNAHMLTQICMQWKADHQKEDPKIETVYVYQIKEILPDGTERHVYREEIKPDPESPYDNLQLTSEEILRRYSIEHDGQFFDWIPCCELLPEGHKLYDITAKSETGIRSYSAIYNPSLKRW